MTKNNNKWFAQDARTVMLGRPPIQSTVLQQMFHKCASSSPVASSKPTQKPILQVKPKVKG